MARYTKTVEVNARKVISITGYPMGTVATLEDGDRVTLTSENTRSRAGFPHEGWYYIQDGHGTFFVSPEALINTYRPLKKETTI